MNLVEFFLLLGFVISTLLIIAVIVINFFILKKRIGRRFFRGILALDIVAFWLYIANAYIYIKNLSKYEHYITPIFLSTIIIAALLNLSSYTMVPRFSYFPPYKKIMTYFSIILISLLLSQYNYESGAKFFWIEHTEYVIKLKANIFFGVLITSWCLMMLVLLQMSTLFSHPKKRLWVKKRVSKIYLSGAILAISGFLLFAIEGVMDYFEYNLYLKIALFISSRLLALTGVMLLLLTGAIDPRCVFSLSRVIQNLTEKKEISFSMIRFELEGPAIVTHYGFNFVDDENQREDYVFKLSLMSMTTLGAGQEYIEGSAIIPMLYDQRYTGLIISSWIKDEKQNDIRYEGRSYIVLTVVIPKNLEWMLYKRVSWEKGFDSFIKKIKNRKELEDTEKIIEFVVNRLNVIALGS